MRLNRAFLAAGPAWLAVVAGCAATAPDPASPAPTAPASLPATAATATAATPTFPVGDQPVQLDPGDFRPDVQEYKLYAKGVGPVLSLGIAGGTTREELVSVDTAPPRAGTGPLGQPNP